MGRALTISCLSLALGLACGGGEYEDIGDDTSGTGVSSAGESGTSAADADSGADATDSDDTTADSSDAGTTTGSESTSDTTDGGDTTDDTGEDDTSGDTGVCEPYGDPGAAGTDCCEGEMGIGAMDIDGFWCAGACTLGGTGECPAAAAGMAQCAIDDGMGGGLCAVLCQDLAGSSDCPTGMTCQDTGQMVGICTWNG